MIRKDGRTMRRLRKLRFALNKPQTAENSGVFLPVGGQGISPALRRAIYLDPYEAHERGVIEKKLAADDVVLELGAGIGFISTFCAKRIGSERVFAVEANPVMAETIRETYRLNGVAPQLTCGLLGQGDGEETFYVEGNFISSSTLQRSASAQPVKTPRYDARAFIEQVRPTFLICDIEGGEQDLLAYMPLTGVKKLCIELHPHVIGNAGTSEIVQRLLNEGFVCDFLSSSGKVFFFERS
ncbi:MAG: FkbM family methyltransferase [Dechloromonas sp.]|nr:FkbM family methyltransferase [Dechloromonas sp.]